MGETNMSLKIAIIIIVIVCIIILIQSIWTISKLGQIKGDSCNCSGISDEELDNLRIYSIISIIAASVGLIFALGWVAVKGNILKFNRDEDDGGSYIIPMRERFTSKSV